MRLLRHAVAGIVLFMIMIGLILAFSTDMEEEYGITPTDLHDGLSIMQRLNNMNLLSGINNMQTAATKLNPPTGSNVEFDIVGGTLIAGIGIVKVIIGIFTAPVEFISIILDYYAEIPSIITELALIVTIYVVFILVSLYHKGEI